MPTDGKQKPEAEEIEKITNSFKLLSPKSKANLKKVASWNGNEPTTLYHRIVGEFVCVLAEKAEDVDIRPGLSGEIFIHQRPNNLRRFKKYLRDRKRFKVEFEEGYLMPYLEHDAYSHVTSWESELRPELRDKILNLLTYYGYKGRVVSFEEVLKAGDLEPFARARYLDKILNRHVDDLMTQLEEDELKRVGFGKENDTKSDTLTKETKLGKATTLANKEAWKIGNDSKNQNRPIPYSAIAEQVMMKYFKSLIKRETGKTMRNHQRELTKEWKDKRESIRIELYRKFNKKNKRA